MNSDTKNMAHPSFIRVVEQLGPLDAQAIDSVGFLEKSQPLIRIFIVGCTSSGRDATN